MSKAGKVVKILIIMLVIILALLLIAGGIAAYYIKSKLSKINYVDINEENIVINEGVDLQEKGYRNIALFGVDSRSDTYNNTRSDCIIIASINQETGDIKLFSVYRDTYLNIEGHGLDKVTHAYAYGGAELALSTLNKNLDLDITEFVTVNFGAVVEIIDAIGGVSIEITSDELQYINNYIANIDSLEGTTTERITSTGVQTLNGVQALAYSRIRYTSGGDYKRTERMRDVMISALDRIKQLSVSELNNIVDLILPQIETNIKENEIISLIPQVAKYNVATSIGWPYEVKGKTISGVWYGIPVTLESAVEQLHKEIFEEKDYQASETVEEISNSIINKTGYKN